MFNEFLARSGANELYPLYRTPTPSSACPLSDSKRQTTHEKKPKPHQARLKSLSHRGCRLSFVLSVFSLFAGKPFNAPQCNHGNHDAHAEKQREPCLTLGPRNQVEKRPDTPEDQDRSANQHHLQPNDFFHSIDRGILFCRFTTQRFGFLDPLIRGSLTRPHGLSKGFLAPVVLMEEGFAAPPPISRMGIKRGCVEAIGGRTSA